MIIGRFKVRCRPDRADEMAAAIAAVEAPSRELPGVVHFDVARSADGSGRHRRGAQVLTQQPLVDRVFLLDSLRQWWDRTQRV